MAGAGKPQSVVRSLVDTANAHQRRAELELREALHRVDTAKTDVGHARARVSECMALAEATLLREDAALLAQPVSVRELNASNGRISATRGRIVTAREQLHERDKTLNTALDDEAATTIAMLVAERRVMKMKELAATVGAAEMKRVHYAENEEMDESSLEIYRRQTGDAWEAAPGGETHLSPRSRARNTAQPHSTHLLDASDPPTAVMSSRGRP